MLLPCGSSTVAYVCTRRRRKFSHESEKIFILLLSQSLQKVQLEEITELWGIYISRDTFNLLEIGMILCDTVD